mgnify:CR=1 FL=1
MPGNCDHKRDQRSEPSAALEQFGPPSVPVVNHGSGRCNVCTFCSRPQPPSAATMAAARVKRLPPLRVTGLRLAGDARARSQLRTVDTLSASKAAPSSRADCRQIPKIRLDTVRFGNRWMDSLANPAFSEQHEKSPQFHTRRKSDGWSSLGAGRTPNPPVGRRRRSAESADCTPPGGPYRPSR